MLRNYLMIAWRTAYRDRLNAVINLLGLSLGLAGAILLALFVRNAVTYERFIPGYQDVYELESVFHQNGVLVNKGEETPSPLAKPLMLAFPEIEAAARLTTERVGVSNGDIEANELVNPVDPEFFAVLPFRFLHGDGQSAFASPDSVVLTAKMALKYFGTDDCLGQTLLLDRQQPVRVSAVLADLPSNTDFHFGILLNGVGAFTRLAKIDAEPPRPRDDYSSDDSLFVRLKPGTDTSSFPARLARFSEQNIYSRPTDPLQVSVTLTPLADLHMESRSSFDETGGPHVILATLVLVGVMILLVAGINFVNLTTAQATQRALEVGVRKAAGATRSQLFVQFMLESVLYALASAVLAVAIVELSLPRFNAWLLQELTFDYWRDWRFGAAMAAATLLYGLLAGIYPALVLSRFKPGVVLKRQALSTTGSGWLRQALVIVQFVVSISLLIATMVVSRQTQFATDEVLMLDTDQILIVSLRGLLPNGTRPTHDTETADRIDALRRRFGEVPGVLAVAAASNFPADSGTSSSSFRVTTRPEARSVETERQAVDFGLFELYGLKLLAGRSFSPEHRAEDEVSFLENKEGSVIINETALRHFGFSSPEAAIGQRIQPDSDQRESKPRQIVGVVPDMVMHKITAPVWPTAFAVSPDDFHFIMLKLDRARLKAALGAIDATWREAVPSRPITRWFLDDRIERLYHDTRTQGEAFALFAGIASVIGCLGLFGLSAYTAQRRIKEIGIRKALGASTGEIVRLLLWQFAKPVLIANAIAWPIAWTLMRSWLNGFAYRIELDWTPFAIAGIGALAIALCTTAFHALVIARRRPVLALRYE